MNRPCTPAENELLAQRGDQALESEIELFVRQNPGFKADGCSRNLYATAAFGLAQSVLVATSRHQDEETFVGAIMGLSMALGATIKGHPDSGEILRLVDSGVLQGIAFAVSADLNALPGGGLH